MGNFRMIQKRGGLGRGTTMMMKLFNIEVDASSGLELSWG